jgi:hypothetical protein
LILDVLAIGDAKRFVAPVIPARPRAPVDAKKDRLRCCWAWGWIDPVDFSFELIDTPKVIEDWDWHTMLMTRVV